MKIFLPLTTAVLGAALIGPAITSNAGFFSKKCCEQCQNSDHCQECGKKKSSSLFSAGDPPRAGSATAIPAVLTNNRADRQPAKAAPATSDVPAVPAATTCTTGGNTPASDARLDSLQRDVNILKEQIRVLSVLLQQAAPPAPAAVPPAAPVPGAVPVPPAQ